MKVTLQHLTKKFPNRNKKAGGDVVAGDKADAAVAEDGSISFMKSAGTNTIPGAVFLDAGSKGDIVRLRIRQ